jgi:hypothetical protein
MPRSIGAYVFVITCKFSWRCNQVLRACLYWENDRILYSTWRGGYWKRFIVVFHSKFNRIITIISADLVECGLLNTEIKLLLTNAQNFTLFCNMTVTLYKHVVTIANHQIAKKRWENIIQWRSFVLEINETSHKPLRKYQNLQNSLQFKICKRTLRFKP